jgi:Flp pilus assembly protein TadG
MERNIIRTSKVLSRRRRGVVVVYVALALIVLLGAAGLSIDMGNLYLQRNNAQRAADAAALAGAVQLMNNNGYDAAAAAAQKVAAANGYDTSVAGTQVVPTPNAEGNSAWYGIYVEKRAPVFFMAIFGWQYKLVGAHAIATFRSPVQIPIEGGGKYGAIGPINLSLFGPLGKRANGDKYSTMYIDNNNPRTPNPFYSSAGYDFTLTIPANYVATNGSKVDVQIFDPDCHNANNAQNAQQGVSIDEMRDYSGNNTSNTSYLTTTKYTLYDTHGTPSTDDDTMIAQKSYGNDSSTDMTWVTPAGFSFDFSSLAGTGDRNVRINVTSTGGSSENGFSLRAGPPIADIRERLKTDKKGNTVYDGNGDPVKQYIKVVNGSTTGNWSDTNPFNDKNGTAITADGRIPMNFNADGQAQITLGYVPANATYVSINKFDTDVGSKSVTYSDGTTTWTGTLSGNDESKEDDYTLPSGYPGGTWTATYTAGLGDTSVWDMSSSGASLNQGYVYLVH